MRRVLLTLIVSIFSVSLSVAQNLIHHWKLDETLASPGFAALEIGAGGYSASVTAAVGDDGLIHKGGTSGRKGPAYESGAHILTGNSLGTQNPWSRIELGNVSPGTNPFAISFWFRRLSAPTSGHDVGSDQEHIISANGNQAGRWNLHTYDFNTSDQSFQLQWFHHGVVAETFTDGFRLSSDTWYHAALTRNSSGLFNIFIDGRLFFQTVDAEDFTAPNAGVFLGRDPAFRPDGLFGFTGVFDDVRIYDDALSRSQVIALADFDTDGLHDNWELKEFNSLAPESGEDPDNDQFTNQEELTAGSNPNEPDTDSDGLNDGADAAAGASPLKSDTDGDGLPDYEEVETIGTDPAKTDTDGDGLSDQREYVVTFTDPLDPDMDKDGLTDGFEILTTMSNPQNPDTDNDGYTDRYEHESGFSPIDPNSKPSAVLLVHPAIELEVITQLGKNYRVQVSSDLQTWVDTEIVIEGTGESVRDTYQRASDLPGRYWRVIEE